MLSFFLCGCQNIHFSRLGEFHDDVYYEMPIYMKKTKNEKSKKKRKGYEKKKVIYDTKLLSLATLGLVVM